MLSNIDRLPLTRCNKGHRERLDSTQAYLMPPRLLLASESVRATIGHLNDRTNISTRKDVGLPRGLLVYSRIAHDPHKLSSSTSSNMDRSSPLAGAQPLPRHELPRKARGPILTCKIRCPHPTIRRNRRHRYSRCHQGGFHGSGRKGFISIQPSFPPNYQHLDPNQFPLFEYYYGVFTNTQAFHQGFVVEVYQMDRQGEQLYERSVVPGLANSTLILHDRNEPRNTLLLRTLC
jgi:hypothetical protein